MKEGEQRHQPSQPEQTHASREGGSGAPGIPPTIHEHTKPPSESPADGGHKTTSRQELQPDTETPPTPAKRPRGRPRLPIPPEEEKRRKKQERQARYYQANRQQLLDSHNRWLEGNREHFNEYKRNHSKQGWYKQARKEYMRNYRKQRRQQSEEEVTYSEQKQSESIQVYPVPDKQ